MQEPIYAEINRKALACWALVNKFRGRQMLVLTIPAVKRTQEKLAGALKIFEK